MAFPTLADTTSGVQTSNSASWTCDYPANIGAGDLLVQIIGADGSATAWAAGSDWVEERRGVSAQTLMFRKKVAAGTESGTFTADLSASEQGVWFVARTPNGGDITVTWNASGLWTF